MNRRVEVPVKRRDMKWRPSGHWMLGLERVHLRKAQLPVQKFEFHRAYYRKAFLHSAGHFPEANDLSLSMPDGH